MASVPLSLPTDYWQNYTPDRQDIEFLTTYLFDKETPLTGQELVPIIVHERIRRENDALLSRQKSSGRLYLPAEEYAIGESLVFPALEWKSGKVVSLRLGVNPGLGEFKVIDVDFDGSGIREFATGLVEHKLNQPVEIAVDDPLLNPQNVIAAHGTYIETQIETALAADESLVKVAARWFPRALLMDISVGQLNLAEAVLDEAGGKPLTTAALVEQLEIKGNVNPNLIEFSLNRALQEDSRFDEVGPTGEVLWCLRRLEPADVQQIPQPLRYIEIPYDRGLLTPQMLSLEAELDDELSGALPPAKQAEEVVISLSYPHWRAGTLPVSSRVKGLFPSALESPRVRFIVVDGLSKEETPAWVVRQHGYVSGLGAFYKKYNLLPGSLLVVARGKKPGQVIITPRLRRPARMEVRTVLVGSDGGIVFANLKQNVGTEYNERMIIAVPDLAGVDATCEAAAKQHQPFEQLVASIMSELVRNNVQGFVHAQELYSAINILRRCPPAPLLAFLTASSAYKHVGDLHYRLAETEVEYD